MDDTERLNWMIFYGASVLHSRDGEDCWVKWPNDEDGFHETPVMTDSRKCIDKAIEMTKTF